MKLTVTQAAGHTVEDISEKYFSKCKTIGDFVKFNECAFFYVRYNDGNDNIETFSIYDSAVLNSSEKDKLFKHEELSYIKLFDDFYDVEITIDVFEMDIFVNITKKLDAIKAWNDFLKELKSEKQNK